MARSEGGYTVVELLVVVVIFGIVMTIMFGSFNRIVSSYGQTVKSLETDIGGLIGLELFRTELGLAGFGLPWSLRGAHYDGESAEHHVVNGDPDTDSWSFNDPSGEGAPRPFVLQNNKGVNGSDYLVLKGSALGWSGSSRRWSFLGYSSTGPVLKPSKSEVELMPGSGDRVIVVDSGVRNGVPIRELVTSGSSFVLSFPRKGDDVPADFRPRGIEDRYLVYGMAPPPEGAEDKVTFPFNRADYYLGVPDKISSICAPGTGVLYRGAVKQNGNFWPVPVLDCVADLQVMFVLDPPGSASVANLYSDDITLETIRALYGETDLDPSDKALALRRHVREVRVYILAQQGKRDPSYSYPGSRIVVGEPGKSSWGSVWDEARLSRTLGREWRHYHWKLYTIAVQPKNLQ